MANDENDVTAGIVMPEEEQEKLVDSLLVEEGIGDLFDILFSTRIKKYSCFST